MTANHLVIMAAGTGGHIVPGLAVAQSSPSLFIRFLSIRCTTRIFCFRPVF